MSIVSIIIFGLLLAVMIASRKIGNKKIARTVSAAAFLGICLCCVCYFRSASDGGTDVQQAAQSFYASQGFVVGEFLKGHNVKRIALLAENGQDEEPLRLLAEALRAASGAEVEMPKLPEAKGTPDVPVQIRPNELDQAVNAQFDAVVFAFNCPLESYRASSLARRTKGGTLRSVFLNYFDPSAARKMIAEGSLSAATARKAADPDARPAATPRATFDVAYQLLK